MTTEIYQQIRDPADTAESLRSGMIQKFVEAVITRDPQEPSCDIITQDICITVNGALRVVPTNYSPMS